MRIPTARGRARASLATLVVGLCLTAGMSACGVATAGQGVPTGLVGGSGSGTGTQASSTGTQTTESCSAEHAGPDRPGTDAIPLVTIRGSSPWSPAWTSRATLALYSDHTVALVPDDAAAPTDTSTGSAPASAAASDGSTAPDPMPGVLRPMAGGWIDRCTFHRLNSQLDGVIRADYGTPQIFDAGTTVLRIARGAGQRPTEVSVYALGLVDRDHGDSGLTAAQLHARRVVADWIKDLRAAITPTGPLPDRVRITPTGPDPWDGTIASVAPPEQDPVPWQGSAVPTACTVAIGDDARDALASMRAALQARTSRPSGPPIAWGIFTAPDGSDTGYLAEQQVLPGDGCR